MGLDSYLYRLHKEAVKQKVDCEIDYDKYSVEEIAYFRKNSALHSFCGEVYFANNGTEEFNGCNLLLDLEDIILMKSLLDKGSLRGTSGPFWGEMSEQKYEQLSSVLQGMIESSKAEPDYVFVYNGNY